MQKNLLTRVFAVTMALTVFSAQQVHAQVTRTIVKKVLSGTDDAEECVPGGSGTVGTMDVSSSDLEIMLDGTKQQIVGVRFTSLDIPQGAVINRAFIQFYAKGDKAPVSGNAYITAENQANATGFTSASFNITGRSQVQDSVLWSGSTATSWGTTGGGSATADQRTPNIAQVLQPVINNASWSPGNALVVLIKGAGVRNAYSYDGGAVYAPTLIIEYTSTATPPLGAVAFPITKGSDWKYLDNGTNQDTAWRLSSFVDTGWAYGPGRFGYGDNPITTLGFGPNSANKYMTSYFRKQFAIASVAALTDSLDIHLLLDDGAAVYINGTEVLRKNMPAGTISYLTAAATAIGGVDETTYYAHRIPKTVLQNGINTIAVEVHQDAATSSDLGFDLELKEMPALLPTNFPLAATSSWRYLDDGTDQGTVWVDSSFNDASWAFGPGKLGYSDNPVTTLSYGPNASNKYITYYFRKPVYIADTSTLTDTVELNILRDDGALVYINGIERVRTNMPAGTINYLTWAPTIVDNADETTYFQYLLPNTVFKNGINTIAVEVHQRDGTSSDLGFDMSILPYTAPVPPPPPLVCDTLPTNHISKFVSVLPSTQPDSLRIPATHTFQMLVQEGDPYTNATNGATKGLFDFTGYVPVNGSSENGYLSINHELGSWPQAGVSILDIAFNTTSHTWQLNNNQPVDFGIVQGTGRNCSGGVTPWGTIITCEETLPSTDANNDGYTDVGWAVEIDPVSKMVMDHNYDNVPDKLWKVGRMSHENVVIGFDNKTLYEGNDENPGYIFKFVADTAGKLGTGNLYVLKLTGAIGTATTGNWILVPTSTPTECNNVRTFATSQAATNFNSVEDVEISPLDSMVYFTSKQSSRVYRFKDLGTTVSNCEIFVGENATNYTINYGTGTASEQWRDGNDNLTFDNEGNLYVLQDGGRNHIWMVKPCHTQASPQVELFAVTPAGCEPTGMTFSPDYRFMFVSMQHPSTGNTTQQLDATNNLVRFNKESAIVIAHKSVLGPNANPLPLSFTSFEAVGAADNTAMLYWDYVSSDVVTRFEVERMVFGSSFEKIGTVEATSKSPFRFTDKVPYYGKNFYRVKAVTANGKEVYTATKMLEFSNRDRLSLAGVCPNPTTGTTNIAMVAPANSNAAVKVVNSVGMIVFSSHRALNTGNNLLQLDMNTLASGVYQVIITVGEEVLSTKIVKE
ncbi:MAG TPA: alkaline phosphatase PhoX [Flavipsychrobacter sp.]|nr:alkaline phosphatase PhoX [Flavipsychrobacter sp.]